MIFEYDDRKSQSNKIKHGIDFVKAQDLWGDPRLLIAPARTVGEPRFIAIGKIENEVWSAIYTERNENIRIISVRRSRTEEEEHYENN